MLPIFKHLEIMLTYAFFLFSDEARTASTDEEAICQLCNGLKKTNCNHDDVVDLERWRPRPPAASTTDPKPTRPYDSGLK